MVLKFLTAALAFAPGAFAARPQPNTQRVAVSLLGRDLKAEFDAWAAEHERPYMLTDALSDEYDARLHKFAANYRKIEGMIAAEVNQTWTLSFSGPFMDMDHDEFKNYLGYSPSSRNGEAFVMDEDVTVSDVDWRSKGAVTPIKNQAQCGSCWAFSTTGSMEGANFLATGKLVSLSEQQLVSCDKVDQGCNGGAMDNGFQYVINNGGINTEENYGYTSGGGVTGTCNTLKEKTKVVTIDSYTDVTQNSESALQAAVQGRPVSVAVDAQTWQFYGGGLFNGLFGYCGTSLDHGVLLVGMTSGSSGYYIVKNSWGESWGESGYIRLPLNKGSKGMCGIAADASYPVKH